MTATVATKTRQLTETERADKYLADLEAEWTAVPSIAAAWPTWDEADRLDLQIEWPIRKDRLMALDQLAAAGQLSPGQRDRLNALKAIISKNRPLLIDLFESCLPDPAP